MEDQKRNLPCQQSWLSKEFSTGRSNWNINVWSWRNALQQCMKCGEHHSRHVRMKPTRANCREEHLHCPLNQNYPKQHKKMESSEEPLNCNDNRSDQENLRNYSRGLIRGKYWQRTLKRRKHLWWGLPRWCPSYKRGFRVQTASFTAGVPMPRPPSQGASSRFFTTPRNVENWKSAPEEQTQSQA